MAVDRRAAHCEQLGTRIVAVAVLARYKFTVALQGGPLNLQ